LNFHINVLKRIYKDKKGTYFANENAVKHIVKRKERKSIFPLKILFLKGLIDQKRYMHVGFFGDQFKDVEPFCSRKWHPDQIGCF
jgi:hypothetical protein